MAKNKDGLSKLLVDGINKKWGNSWVLLGDELREALVAQAVFYSFAAFDDSVAITTQMMDERILAVRKYCGLYTE